MYAGDVSCKDAFESLKSDPQSALIDVRTTREWETIGVPDLSSISKEVMFAEWQMFPSMQVDSDFATKVSASLEAQGVAKDTPIYFLCRSGVRSQGAANALTELGYTKAYNIIAGFEGEPDAAGERSNINGWMFNDLPFRKEKQIE